MQACVSAYLPSYIQCVPADSLNSRGAGSRGTRRAERITNSVSDTPLALAWEHTHTHTHTHTHILSLTPCLLLACFPTLPVCFPPNHPLSICLISVSKDCADTCMLEQVVVLALVCENANITGSLCLCIVHDRRQLRFARLIGKL